MPLIRRLPSDSPVAVACKKASSDYSDANRADFFANGSTACTANVMQAMVNYQYLCTAPDHFWDFSISSFDYKDPQTFSTYCAGKGYPLPVPAPTVTIPTGSVGATAAATTTTAAAVAQATQGNTVKTTVSSGGGTTVSSGGGSTTTDSSGPSMAPIIGGAVGGIVVVALIVFAYFKFGRKSAEPPVALNELEKQRPSRPERQDNNPPSNAPSYVSPSNEYHSLPKIEASAPSKVTSSARPAKPLAPSDKIYKSGSFGESSSNAPSSFSDSAKPALTSSTSGRLADGFYDMNLKLRPDGKVHVPVNPMDPSKAMTLEPEKKALAVAIAHKASKNQLELLGVPLPVYPVFVKKLDDGTFEVPVKGGQTVVLEANATVRDIVNAQSGRY
ncbi:hypothetical protein HDU99_002398 [Rhizoclosmatium hyalinum]|nr:hypothetical protein HDU99_002398 [Rhizoclosmatium hyalinum]